MKRLTAWILANGRVKREEVKKLYIDRYFSDVDAAQFITCDSAIARTLGKNIFHRIAYNLVTMLTYPYLFAASVSLLFKTLGNPCISFNSWGT